MEAVLHELSMWTVVDVDDGRIPLCWIEVRGLNQAVVQVCLTIVCLDRPEDNLWRNVASLWVV